jgi:hypothetical protein
MQVVENISILQVDREIQNAVFFKFKWSPGGHTAMKGRPLACRRPVSVSIPTSENIFALEITRHQNVDHDNPCVNSK